MKLKPLFDKVVVKIIEEKEEKRGSFFLPSTAQEKSEIAEVIAVGPGGNLDGKGSRHAGQARRQNSVCKVQRQRIQGRRQGEVVIIRQSDILAIVE